MEETLQTLRFLVGIGPPLLLFFVILVIVLNVLLPKYLPSTSFLEAPLLLLVMNTLFLFIIPFVVALIALRGYIEDGSANLLFFGCGMLSFSLACFVAGWLGAQAQANANLTIHNTGVLLASLFNFLAGVTLYLRKSARKDGEKQKKNTGIFAYLGIVIFTAGLSFAALRGYTPAFSVPGSGPTLLREVVLIAATIFFGISCLLIVVFDRDRRSFFLSCYAVALALITVGLIALMTSKRANSPLSWLGRSAQFTAGIYFLAAVVAAVRAAWTNRWTVPDAIRDFLRPSEALYRDLVETTTDAIIPISTSREILLWNTAAEQMFGYNRVEALRLVPSDLIDPEDSKRMFQEIEAGAVSGKGSYAGKVREVKALRKSGDEFPAELSFASRQSGGGWISTLIIRDITERKQTEEALRKSEERLRQIIETSPVAIGFGDSTGKIFEANESFYRLTGYTREEIRARQLGWDRLTAPEYAEMDRQMMAMLAATGSAGPYEKEYIRKDSSRVPLLLSVSKLPGRDEHVAFIFDITERRRAEEELKKSETKYRIVADNTYDFEFWINPQGQYIYVSPSSKLITGYDREDFIKDPDLRRKVVHSDDRSIFDGHREDDEENRKASAVEYRIIHADGSIRWISHACQPVFSNEGEYLGIRGINRDITERKQAEEKLAAVHRQVQSIIDNTTSIIYAFDLEERFLLANTALAELLNSTPEQMIGKRRHEFMPKDDADWHEANDRQVIETGKALQFEEHSQLKGHSITWLTTKFPLRDVQGRIYAVGGISADVSERKRAEEELRKSEERYRSVVQNTTAVILRLDQQGVIRFANQRALEFFGYSKDELIGKRAVGTIVPEQETTGRDLATMVDEILKNPDGFHSNANENLRMNGERVWMEWTNSGIYDKEGRLTEILSVGIDATERQRVETRLAADLAALTRMHGLSRKVLEAKGLQPLLQEVMDAAVAIMGAKQGTLQLLEGDSLRIVAYHGHQQPFLDFFESAENRASVCGEATRRGERLIVPDVETSPLFAGTPSLAVLREAGVRAVQSTPMVSRTGTLLGILTTQWEVPYSPNEHDFLRIDLLARQAADLIDQKRTVEALERRTSELQHLTETLEERVKERTAELADLSSQLVSAQENERRRISYQLHDNVWQTLLGIRSEIERLFSSREDWMAVQARSKRVMSDILDIIAKIRSMQGDLWPYVLDDIGLLATIDWYCRDFEKNYPNVTIERQGSLAENDVAPSTKIVIYRIMQEALSNISKHSQASRVTLHLVRNDHGVQFSVQDNGIGFDPVETMARRAPWGGLGLLSIRARTELSGGTLGIESVKGKGTTIRASWPV